MLSGTPLSKELNSSETSLLMLQVSDWQQVLWGGGEGGGGGWTLLDEPGREGHLKAGRSLVPESRDVPDLRSK